MDVNPNRMMLQEYVDCGFCLVPIPLGSKAPVTLEWNKKDNCIYKGHGQLNGGNVGLAHAYCGTCTLDIDDFQATSGWFTAHGLDLASYFMCDGAVQIISGKPNRAKLLYRTSVTLPSVEVEGIFELRCAAKNGLTVQDLLPPSIHPDTHKPIEWRGDWKNLPTLPDDLLSLWKSILRPSVRNNSQDSNEEVIGIGARNQRLASIAGSLRRQGLNAETIYKALAPINTSKCSPPLEDKELWSIAKSVNRYTPNPQHESSKEKQKGNTVSYVRLNEVEPTPIEWVAEGILAIGKITLLVGQPGIGKTQVLTKLCHSLTTGVGYPFSGNDSPGNVLYISIELDRGYMAYSFSGRQENFIHLESIQETDENGQVWRRPIHPFYDFDAIDQICNEAGGVGAVIVDTLGSHMNSVIDSREVNKVMSSLEDLMVKYTACCVLAVHTNKDPNKSAIDRVGGSSAIAGRASFVFTLGKDKDNSDVVHIVSSKSRYTDMKQYNFSLNIKEGKWLFGESGNDPNELLREKESGEGATRKWLKEALSDGPRRVGDLKNAWRNAGYNDNAIQVTRQRMNIVSYDDPPKSRKFYWMLPV